MEPPLYDLAQIGPFAFIGKNNFDAGLLWSTVYEEGQHLLQLQGKLLTNADVLLSEISIKAVQLQNHHYYPYWSSLTYQKIDFGINKNKRRLQNA